MIRGVIFDMDGVLIDSETLGMAMLKETADTLGYRFSDSMLLTTIGTTRENCERCYRTEYPDFDAASFFPMWKQKMFDHMAVHGVPFKPGALEALRGLKERGIKLGLATSNDRHVVERYFEMGGLTGLFDARAHGDQIKNSKPAPDIYLLAAQLLSLPPAQCLGVEDSYNGVRAIRAAGIRCVMVPDMLPYRDELKPFVDDLLPDLNGLLPLIDQLNETK